MKRPPADKQPPNSVAQSKVCGECLATNEPRRSACWLCQAKLVDQADGLPPTEKPRDNDAIIVAGVTLAFLVLLVGAGSYLAHGRFTVIYLVVVIPALVGAATGLLTSQSSLVQVLERFMIGLGVTIGLVAALGLAFFVAMFVLCFASL